MQNGNFVKYYITNEDNIVQTVQEQVERLKKVFNVKTDIALAEALHVSKNTISAWKGRDGIPITALNKVARNENVHIEWLLDGVGRMDIADTELLEYDIKKIEHTFNNSLDPKILKVISKNDNLQKLISLFGYAPDEFIMQIITRLEKFKEMSVV